MMRGTTDNEVGVGGFTEDIENMFSVPEGNSKIKKIDLKAAYLKGKLNWMEG